jgi:hypothetical protein
VFSTAPTTADPAPSPRPAPELDRYDRLTTERSGQPAPEPEHDADGQAIGVLAIVLERDGQELSATQQLTRNLASADHLAILHAIWTTETTAAREQRYRALLDTALPAGYQGGEPGHKARWLWRTLRAAELAGLDARQLLQTAIGQRSLTDALDVTAVIDARIRHLLGTPVPLPPRPWSGQVPVLADPDRQQYVTEIAAAMDARKERIGEHAAEHPPAWATAALGPVPADPLDRLDWQHKASAIGTYRELCGYDHPAEPIGPEPAGDTPDKRAAWHQAHAALAPADGPDIRSLPDGSLLQLRDAYPVETAWAPAWVGDQLRQVRRGAEEARLAAIRAAAEHNAAHARGHPGTARQHETLAASYQAMETAYRQREKALAAGMDDRREWERVTADQRRLAVAADAELRRRHQDQAFPLLRSAEPAPPTQAESDELNLSPDRDIPQMGQWISDLSAQPEEFSKRLAERQHPVLTQEGSEHTGLSQLLHGWGGFSANAILQPPKPEIRPSARVLERKRERQADMEAAH